MIFLIFMAAMTATVTTGIINQDKKPTEKITYNEKVIVINKWEKTKKPIRAAKICKEWSK